MSDTAIAYAAVCLHACYAIPGTPIAYPAIRLRRCYAMSSSDIAYRATSDQGRSSRSVNPSSLCNVRY
eukprot:1350306-Rhodomonas_salina.4